MNNYLERNNYKNLTILIVNFKSETILNKCLSKINNKIKNERL